jgi:transmembrane sensor
MRATRERREILEANMAEDPSRRRLGPGTGLATPLARLLRSDPDEATTGRIWRGIEARLPSREPAPRAVFGRLGVAAVLLLLASGALASWRLGLWTPRALADRWREPNALVLAEGGNLESVEGGPTEARSATLSDGSKIEAAPGARVEALASTPTELALVVRRGQVRFSVTPGGPRRWSIEARGVRVEVVGTVLSVAARERSVSIGVEIGAVVVRSPLLADGVTRLVAGQTLELPAEPTVAAAPEAPAPVAPPPSVEVAAPPVPGPVRAPPRAAEVRSSPRDLEARDSVTPRDAEHEAARRRWADADAARAAGDVPRAIRLLEQLLREHPDDPRASLAAFTLGTLFEGEPQRAASAFRQALDLGLPSVLRDTCYARLASALYAAGDRTTLRAVAAEYRSTYPHGEQRRALDELEAAASRSGD